MTLVLDDVGLETRKKIRTLHEQIDRVRATVAELKDCDPNDPFATVAIQEQIEGESALIVLEAEAKLLEDALAGEREDARRQADSRFRDELRPQLLDLLKAVDKARGVRRKILAAVEQHERLTGWSFDGIPFGAVEALDDVRVAMSGEGLL